jgi:hypothetical protein
MMMVSFSKGLMRWAVMRTDRETGKRPSGPACRQAASPLRTLSLLIFDYGQGLEATGACEKALRVSEKGLTNVSCDETLYQRLIVCCRHPGRGGRAVRHYHRCCDRPACEPGVSPSLETQRLYEDAK